jgi:glyoxylase I family protein
MLAAIHEGIPVSDLDAAIVFYTEVLGLQSMPRPNFPFPGAWLGNADGRVEIHLFPSDELKPGPEAKPSNIARHTAFVVDNLDAWRDHLRALGVPFMEMSGFVPSAQVFVTDPDGHTIEFQQA